MECSQLICVECDLPITREAAVWIRLVRTRLRDGSIELKSAASYTATPDGLPLHEKCAKARGLDVAAAQ